MKRIVVVVISLIMVVSAVAGFAGCGNFDLGGGDLLYDRYPTDYDPDIDSWEQIDPDDEDVEITWFTNYTYTDRISDLIYKRTGVKVKFQSAMTADNTELNTMIAGGKLPDVITLGDLSTRVQLAEEGYCYAIDELAKSYAPSLLKRISPEHLDYYSASDGHTYGLASNFYNDADIAEYEDEIGGHQYCNYDVLVRRDYLNAYLQYKGDSFNADTDLTKPDGFIEMCKWIKSTYKLADFNPTVCLSPFSLTATNDCFSYSLSALMEMFCVPYEDADGNYVYQYDTEGFVEVIKFLNELYTNHLVNSSNFSYTREDIGTQILNGNPAVLIGAGQTLKTYFSQRERSGYDATTGEVADSNEYVSVVLTNANGDAPLLLDYAGRGLYVTMITNNCNREDRVIKVIDYMMSEQGQREFFYGETLGEYADYVIQPGEINPDTGEVSTYGVLEWTDKAKNLISQNNYSALYSAGICRETMLTNLMQKKMLCGTDDYNAFLNLDSYLEYRMKSTYFDYCVSRVPFRYPIDSSDIVAVNEYITQQANIEAVWIEALPKLIKAENETELMSEYNTALELSYAKGAEEWTEFRNTCFKDYKEYLGIDYAWPKADPSYEAPPVTLYGTAEKYAIEVPDYITWNM